MATRGLPRDQDGNVIKAPESIAPNLDSRRVKGSDVALVRQTREYELITPLFGGGTETKKADPVSIIRVPSIRGQLRFWWRACRAAQCSSIEEMKKVEDFIWGSTEAPSAVIIRLKFVEEARSANEKDKIPFTVEKYKKDGHDRFKVTTSPRIAAYAAFPLLPDKNQRKQDGWKSPPVCIGVKFKIEILYPQEVSTSSGKAIDLREEVGAALWAWENFGGVGARTRRGFGALKLCKIDGDEQVPPSATDIESHLRKKAEGFVCAGEILKGVPQLTQSLAMKIYLYDESTEETWKKLIEKLSQFRQERNPKTQKNRPGRSKWPEPERIRELTKQRLNQGYQSHQSIEPKLEEFPRAAFGLPIVFQFQQASNNNPNDRDFDPRKTILHPSNYERLSSPLILRPLACTNGKAAGLALILGTGKSLDELGVTLTTQEGNQESWPVKTELDKDKAKKIVRPDGTKLLGDEKDVLKAFLSYLDD